MVLDVDKVRLTIENYFKNVTKEKLHQDLLDAGLEIYSKSTYKIDEPMSVTGEGQEIGKFEETTNDNTFYEKLERENIVRPAYFFRVEAIESANSETNNKIVKKFPTTTSSLNWSKYYGDQSRIQKDISGRI